MNLPPFGKQSLGCNKPESGPSPVGAARAVARKRVRMENVKRMLKNGVWVQVCLKGLNYFCLSWYAW